MKTTVKFKDLPELVQEFMERLRVTILVFGDETEIGLNWLHTLPEWKEATDQERLAYAKWRYPVGAKAISTQGVQFIVKGIPYISKTYSQHIIAFGSLVLEKRTIYDPEMNKWADIVSEPEVTEPIKFRFENESYIDQQLPGESIDDFRNRVMGLEPIEEDKEPEYTAGEIVEVWDEYDWQLYIFAFSAEGKYWFRTFRVADSVHSFEQYRKHNPDRVYQEIAERIAKQEAFDSDILPVYMKPSDIKQMLITAAKEGEKLKK